MKLGDWWSSYNLLKSQFSRVWNNYFKKTKSKLQVQWFQEVRRTKENPLFIAINFFDSPKFIFFIRYFCLCSLFCLTVWFWLNECGRVGLTTSIVRKKYRDIDSFRRRFFFHKAACRCQVCSIWRGFSFSKLYEEITQNQTYPHLRTQHECSTNFSHYQF